ncbi:hypothetical protein KEU06_06240 [Pseudaminobacter sp. 19-2017]|uniref:Uncharacterized protein n=1 Tax=Pseudaminobacter soli (ex Zhang et al. 2022) TaxID=2831468 RepID=A0A942DWF1_9HYPH|nr:hypothetical protein [Pseudaminobacter soli]MBS3648223.1 hypothetical protein [Pseudaminobacter soli]
MGAKKRGTKASDVARDDSEKAEKLLNSSDEQVAAAEAEAAPAELESVSEGRFEQMVSETLDTVGGKMLFKMRIDGEPGGEHVAAAAVGEGDDQHFLILSMPLEGGELQVEEAAESANPVAKIAASYAGIAEKLDDAA